MEKHGRYWDSVVYWNRRDLLLLLLMMIQHLALTLALLYFVAYPPALVRLVDCFDAGYAQVVGSAAYAAMVADCHPENSCDHRAFVSVQEPF